MGEALLIQMNEFDLQLESDLRLFLDPIAAAPHPPRRGKRTPEAPAGAEGGDAREAGRDSGRGLLNKNQQGQRSRDRCRPGSYDARTA